MGSAPTPAPGNNQQDALTRSETFDATRQVLEEFWNRLPEWMKRDVSVLGTAIFAGLRLTAYMLTHFVVGIVFAKFIAQLFPKVSHYLELMSVCVFGSLIVKALIELFWEECLNFVQKLRR